jgi:acetylornithine deacetylase
MTFVEGKTMDSAIPLLERLVAFDTVSANSNLPLLDFVRGYLQRYGVSSRLVFNQSGDKANLYCTIGRDDIGGIMLSGHTDVVPVEGQRWSTDPFRMVSCGNRLHGRGTADMKGWVAGVLAWVPEITKRNLAVPVHIALSHDEEIGCVGVRSLVDILARSDLRPRLCVVGEPTEMQVVIAHKGKQYLRVHVRGLEGHSSLSPFGVNAIENAAQLIVHLQHLGERKQRDGPFDSEFDVPYSTVMTGVVHGGTNLNIVPNYCWFDFEVREIPGDDPFALIDECKRYANDHLLPRMRTISANATIEFEEVSLRPNLDTPIDEEIVTLAKSWAGREDHGKVAFGTEGALFQRHANIPTVVCGPGSIRQAHKPDEYVELEQLERFDAFMRRLVVWASNDLHDSRGGDEGSMPRGAAASHTSGIDEIFDE